MPSGNQTFLIGFEVEALVPDNSFVAKYVPRGKDPIEFDPYPADPQPHDLWHAYVEPVNARQVPQLIADLQPQMQEGWWIILFNDETLTVIFADEVIEGISAPFEQDAKYQRFLDKCAENGLTGDDADAVAFVSQCREWAGTQGIDNWTVGTGLDIAPPQ